MLRRSLLRSGLVAVFFWTSVALANFCTDTLELEILSNLSNKYKLGSGSSVRLKEENSKEVIEAVFLGRTVSIEGKTSDFAFYSPKTDELHLFEPQQIRIRSLGETGAGEAHGEIAPIVMSRNQQGGTCAAYTIYNCYRHLEYRNAHQSDALKARLGDEGARQDFIAHLIDQVYLTGGNGLGTGETIYKTAQTLGLDVERVAGRELPTTVLSNLEKGWPVILRFDCGDDMCNMGYQLITHTRKEQYPVKLWQPLKGDPSKSPGGHAVLLAGVMDVGEGKKMLLVSDPNFQAPRLWPVENLSNQDASLVAWTIMDQKMNDLK